MLKIARVNGKSLYVFCSRMSPVLVVSTTQGGAGVLPENVLLLNRKSFVNILTFTALLSPADGHCDFLILPSMTKACMDIFLQELSKRYPGDYLLLICDGAACHQMGSPTLSDNVMMETLPPYCPDLNPCENLWDEIRETFFHNCVFKSMDAVEDQLVTATNYYEKNTDSIKSISSWHWIINTY